jgi:hypothetical protein
LFRVTRLKVGAIPKTQFYMNTTTNKAHIFLAPPHTQINKPSEEDKLKLPNFGGYILDEPDPTKPQSFVVNFIVKYKVTEFNPIASSSEVQSLSMYSSSDTLYTFYIFSPWNSEKNALNQVKEFLLSEIKIEDKYADGSKRFVADFMSCERIS